MLMVIILKNLLYLFKVLICFLDLLIHEDLLAKMESFMGDYVF